MTPQDKLTRPASSEPDDIDLDQFDEAVGKSFGIPKGLRAALKGQESGGQDTDTQGRVLTSGRGAQGRLQVLPSTVRKYKDATGRTLDPSDPYDRIYAGWSYLKEKHDQVDSSITDEGARWAAALAGYHGGERQIKAINKSGGEIAPGNDGHIETADYVDQIMSRWAKGSQASAAPAVPVTQPAPKTTPGEKAPTPLRQPTALDTFGQQGVIPDLAPASTVSAPPVRVDPATAAGLKSYQQGARNPVRAIRPNTLTPNAVDPGELNPAHLSIQEQEAALTRLTAIPERARTPEQRQRFTQLSQMAGQRQTQIAQGQAAADQAGWEEEQRQMLKDSPLAKAIPYGAGENMAQVGNRFARGAISATTDIPRGVGAMTNPMALEAAEAAVGPLREWAKEAFPTDSGAGFWSGTLPEAAGSVVPFLVAGMAAGPAAPLSAAMLGAAQNAAQTYDEARAAGFDENNARSAARIGALIGTSEAVGLEGEGFEKFAMKSAFREHAMHVLEEAGQEGLSQFLNNVNAKMVSGYDPTRALSEGVAESAAAGGLIGAGFQGASIAGERMGLRSGEGHEEAPTAQAPTGPDADLRAKLTRPRGTPIQDEFKTREEMEGERYRESLGYPAITPRPSQEEMDQTRAAFTRPRDEQLTPKSILEDRRLRQKEQNLAEADRLNQEMWAEEETAQEARQAQRAKDREANLAEATRLNDQMMAQAVKENEGRQRVEERQKAAQAKTEAAETARTEQEAKTEIGQIKNYDSALQSADESEARAQSLIDQGQHAEAIAELQAQKAALQTAGRSLPSIPKNLDFKTEVARRTERINQRITDLRRAARSSESTKVTRTQPIPPSTELAEQPVNPPATPPHAESIRQRVDLGQRQPVSRITTPEQYEAAKTRRADLVTLESDRGPEMSDDLRDEMTELGSAIKVYESAQPGQETQPETVPPRRGPKVSSQDVAQSYNRYSQVKEESVRQAIQTYHDQARADLEQDIRDANDEADARDLERGIAAIDRLFDDGDSDMLDMYERAVKDEPGAEEDFAFTAEQAYGIDPETARTIVRSQRDDRARQKATRSQSIGTEGRRPGGTEPVSSSRETGAAAKGREIAQNDVDLINQEPGKVPGPSFDAYLQGLESLRNDAITGKVDLPDWAWRQVNARIKEASENRRGRRVAENLGPKNPAPKAPGKFSKKTGFTPNEAGPMETSMESSEPETATSPAETSQPKAEEEPRTVSHPDPKIHGKEIIAETADGRVVVENPDNKGGVSVVRDRSGEREAPRAGDLAGHFTDLFTSGRRFSSITEARKAAAEFLGSEVKPGTIEAKQVDEAIEAGAVRAARKIVEENRGNPEKTYDLLVDLYERQPNLNVRTSTSITQQAYSTPLPLAYLASRLAGIDEKTTVYEPTAGNGALTIEADPENVRANELNPDRAAQLREQGYNVTENDAADWRPSGTSDVVIANPPFGPVKDETGKSQKWKPMRGFDTTEIDHAIAFKALDAMNTNGRASLILASIPKTAQSDEAKSAAYNAAAKRRFYFYLYQNYNVVDHFTVSGDLYTKQGAGWPVDVIVIDGKGKSKLALPAVSPPRIYESYEELKGLLSQTGRSDRGMGASAESETGRDTRRQGAEARPDDVPVTPDRSGQRPTEEGGARRGARTEGPVERGGAKSEQSGRSGASDSGARTETTGAESVPETGRRSGRGRRGIAQADRVDQPGAVGERPDSGTERAQSVGDIFDEEFEKMFGEQAEEKPAKGPGAPRKPKVESTQEPSIKESTKKAAKETAAGLDDVAKGLGALFGDPNIMGSGPAFDEETYRKAKPLFQQAYDHFKEAAKSVNDAMRLLLQSLNQQYKFAAETLRKMKPYIVRFIEDIAAPQAETKTETETAPRAKTEQPKPKDSDTHRVYQPSSKSNSVDTLIPVNMADQAKSALAKLESRVGNLDGYVADKLDYDRESLKDYFSAEQVDTLALALDNLERGTGYIVGHQTGIGKGRVVAGIIRYAMKTGKTPIFVTEKPSLYADMVRDLTDIGIPMEGVKVENPSWPNKIKPLLTNASEAVPISDAAFEWADEAEKAKLQGGRPPAKPANGFLETEGSSKHNALMARIARSGLTGSGYDAIFTTYNQMQTVKGEQSSRHDLLDRLSNGAVIIFDESHNAGGGEPKFDKEGNVIEDRARFARKLARNAAGVFYSSATYAKRPEVMDLYFKTDLGKAVDNLALLPDVINKGGIPLQQVTASMLADAGQYLRLERSFEGVDYDVTPAPVSRASADGIASALSKIVEFDKMKQDAAGRMQNELAAAGNVTGSDSAMSVSSTNFTAVLHNVIDQMLLSLKADAAADTAIQALKNGEKPVITVANTMGSFIEEFAAENDLKPGDATDIDFKGILLRYLEKARRVLIKKPDRTTEQHYLTDEELGPNTVAAYKAAKSFINSLDLAHLPVSPIDHIHAKLRKAGYKTAEITGRSQTIDYSGDTPVYRIRPASEASTLGKTKARNGFNDGAIDALIINQSGATGISLHASEKVKDQRRRHMIIAQAEKNVDTHMQMLGRVHRTGQVIPPRYTQMAADIPAEKRPAAVLAKKMASLNANTTAARGSAVTAKNVVDFLNQYGDQVAYNLISEDPELSARLGEPINYDADNPAIDAMRKVTGRIPMLPIAEQEEVYQRLENEYTALLSRLDAMGTNALEAKTMDLRAETLDSVELTKDKGGDSPFTQGSQVERAKVRRIGKPMKSEEVLNLLKTSLGEQNLDFDRADQIGTAQAKKIVEAARNEVVAQITPERDARHAKIKELKAKLEAETDEKAQAKLEKEISEREMKSDAADRSAQEKYDIFRTLINMLHPGAGVNVASKDGSLYGIVTELKRDPKAKSPLAMSAWKASIAVADAARMIEIPLSQITTRELASSVKRNTDTTVEATEHMPEYNSETRSFDYVPIGEAFDKGQTESKETRHIVTGNILAGYGALPKGQIINYTDKAGQVKQGVLMPRGFDLQKELSKQIETFADGAEALDYIDESGKKIRTSDDALEIGKDVRGGSYVFETPKAKSVGGKFYQNKALLEAAGKDFVSAGGKMRVLVDRETAAKMIETLYSGKVGGGPQSLVKNRDASKIETKPVALASAGPKWQTGQETAVPKTFEEAKQLVSRARSKFENAARDGKGVLWINHQSSILIARALQETGAGIGLNDAHFAGLNAPVESLQRAADVLRNIAPAYGAESATLTDLAANMEQAAAEARRGRREFAVIADSTLPDAEVEKTVNEEFFHVWQREAGLLDRNQADQVDRHFAKDPAYSKVRAQLLDQKYPNTTPILTVEAAAKLASGQAEDYGVSEEDAYDFLHRYYSFINRRFGPDVLTKEITAAPTGRRALEDVREINGIRSAGSDRIDQRSVRPGAPQRANQGAVSLASVGRRNAGRGADGSEEENDRGNQGGLAGLRAITADSLRAPGAQASNPEAREPRARSPRLPKEPPPPKEYPSKPTEGRRSVKWYDALRSPLSNLNYVGTYEAIGGPVGRQVSEAFSQLQFDLANGKYPSRERGIAQLRRNLKPLQEKLREQGQAGLARWIDAHVDALVDPDEAFRGLAGFLKGFHYNWKLRFNPRSAGVNWLQPLQTLWPHMTTGEFMKILAEARRPETRQRIAELAARESGGKVEEIDQGDKPSKWYKDPFGAVSTSNRIMGHLAGELFADRLGVEGEEKERMAADWSKKVEFDNSRFGVPPLFRGTLASVIGQFKPFMIKNLERLYSDWKSAPEGTSSGALARRAKIIASQFAIGGVRSFLLPGVKEIAGVLVLGYLAKALARWMDDDDANYWAESIYFGAPSLIQQDLSSSVMLMDSPIGRSPSEKMVNFFGGPTASLLQKLWTEGKYMSEAKDGDRSRADKLKASGLKIAKAISPYTKFGESVYNVATGRPFTMRQGDEEVPMTPPEAIGYGALGSPRRQTRYYDEKEAFGWQKELLGLDDDEDETPSALYPGMGRKGKGSSALTPKVKGLN